MTGCELSSPRSTLKSMHCERANFMFAWRSYDNAATQDRKPPGTQDIELIIWLDNGSGLQVPCPSAISQDLKATPLRDVTHPTSSSIMPNNCCQLATTGLPAGPNPRYPTGPHRMHTLAHDRCVHSTAPKGSGLTCSRCSSLPSYCFWKNSRSSVQCRRMCWTQCLR